MSWENTKYYMNLSGDYHSLHAFVDIRQGEEILILPTEVLLEPDMYSIEMHPGLHIDCDNHPVGSVNHSCDPNAALRGNRLIAWKCIAAGEEITIDYKRTETKLAAPFNCSCGTKKCRGKIE